MVTEVVNRPQCNSENIVKNGFAPNNGKQKYHSTMTADVKAEDHSPGGLHRRAQGGDPTTRLPGEIESARAQAYGRRIAHYGHQLP